MGRGTLTATQDFIKLTVMLNPTFSTSAATEAILDWQRDLVKVIQPVSGRAETRSLPHNEQAHTNAHSHTQALRSSVGLVGNVWLLSSTASCWAPGYFFCKLLQASSVIFSGLCPQLHQAGSLNEMAPKFLKWFNKTYSDCNVQFIVANYCPSVGKNDLQLAILLSAS